MKNFIFILLLFSSSALAGEMILTENYSITVNLADSLAPDNSFSPEPAPVFAYVDPNRWTTTNTVLEVIFQILNIIDWGQTRYIAENPDYGVEQPGKYHEVESAWAIGKNPSSTDVDRLMLASAVLHPIISYYLPTENIADFLPFSWRTLFQSVTIGGKLNNTISNASIGIKVSF